MFASACPSCRGSGVPLSHKVAASLDTLVPARCRNCGKYSIVLPATILWLGSPELVVAPVAFLAWLTTKDLRLAVQLGLLAYAAVFCVAAKKAALVDFVPEDGLKAGGRRSTLLWILAGVLTAALWLTALLPATL